MIHYHASRDRSCTVQFDVETSNQFYYQEVCDVVRRLTQLWGRAYAESAIEACTKFVVSDRRRSVWLLTEIERSWLQSSLTPAEFRTLVSLRIWTRRSADVLYNWETGHRENVMRPECQTTWVYSNLNSGQGMVIVAISRD